MVAHNLQVTVRKELRLCVYKWVFKMKLDENKLRRIVRGMINESFSDDPRIKALRSNLDQRNTHADKIKGQLKSFDRSFIVNSYELCESMPDLDFKRIVRDMISDMLENNPVYDRIHTNVGNLMEILHQDKLEVFYIENENIENDVQMEFVFKTVTDIVHNLTNYYVDYFVAIGQGQ